VLAYSINFLAILFDGILIPTVSSPAVTTFGIISLAFNIIVKGPGQNSFINFLSNSFDSLATLLIITHMYN